MRLLVDITAASDAAELVLLFKDVRSALSTVRLDYLSPSELFVH